jgi:hypothetical protein
MARVYVSSTFDDLKDYRLKVSTALRRLGHEDVAMEYYVPEDKRPLDRSLDDVASCDVYVGIFAWRYGYIPIAGNPDELSITELEYRTALAVGKTCLIFLISEDAPWPRASLEFAAMDRIQTLRQELMDNDRHTVWLFENSDELARKVNEAVINWEKQAGLSVRLKIVTPRIFLSYRHEEATWPARTLADALDSHYGEGMVFQDIDSILPGEDFVDIITNAVGSCDVLLVLIGEQWITMTDENERRRLDDPEDVVRLEIEAGLKRNVLVIPILLSGARMPRADELPPSLAKLARRQALELDARRFKSATGPLFTALDRALAQVQPDQMPRTPEYSGTPIRWSVTS